MKLISLTLENFQGIKSLEITPDGKNVTIYGDNGTGKTTINNAVSWLLFDKDSHGNKNFDIKTIEGGEVKHNLTHAVEGKFSHDGREVVLRKEFKEKWTKKRGQAEAEFTGHTTKYFIDGVPAKKKEYLEKVAEIATEETFRLLSTPNYFPAQMKWQDRRALLLEVCGDVTDADVIASDSALARLPEILGGKSIDDYRKIITGRRAEINKALDAIPHRIDENERDMPDVSGIDIEAVRASISELQERVNAKKDEIKALQDSSGAATLREKIAAAKALVSEARAAFAEKDRKLRNEYNDRLSALRRERSQIRWASPDNIDAEISRVEREIEVLRRDFQAEQGRLFEPVENMTCNTCGQDIPEALQHATFNAAKAAALEGLNAKGKELKAKLEELKDRKAAVAAAKGEALARIATIDEDIEKINRDISSLPTLDDYEPYKTGVAAVEQLQAELDQLLAGDNSAALEKARAELVEIEADLAKANAYAQAYADHQKIMARTVELENEQRKLSAEFEKIESELFLIEQFTRAKVGMLEGSVNKHFKVTRFRLFEEQINGGIKDCCEVLDLNGIPYSSTLNTGARINVGIDIINTLSRHFGISVPIIIDNAESVTEITGTEAQVIRLVVSENDKELRMEVD